MDKIIFTTSGNIKAADKAKLTKAGFIVIEVAKLYEIKSSGDMLPENNMDILNDIMESHTSKQARSSQLEELGRLQWNRFLDKVRESKK